MRRPGFLGGTYYWFGEVSKDKECIVCTYNVCKNICTKEEQTKRLKASHKKLRNRAARTVMFTVTEFINIKDFAMRSGESQGQRLKRLDQSGLYVPGAKMSVDYANLVNFGTMDKSRIVDFQRRKQKWIDEENQRRYGTSNIRKITDIEQKRDKRKKEMWKRLYGTINTDEIYRIPDKQRKALCDADRECISIWNEESNKLRLLTLPPTLNGVSCPIKKIFF